MGPKEIFDCDSDTEFLEQEVSEPYNDGEEKDIRIGDYDGDNYEFIDDSLNDIDFSEIRGDFKSSLKQLNRKLKKPRVKKIPLKKKAKGPLKNVPVKNRATLHSKGHRSIERVLVPPEREVIIRGVDDFMLTENLDADSYKNIGYYKGEKLREMNLTFNNSSAIDFTLELFNPTMMLDYLWQTGGNLNNKIEIAGNTAATYSDIVYYMLANPTLIPSMRIVISGPDVQGQINQGLIFKNKNIAGEQTVNPLNVPQQIDTLQFQGQVIAFDIMRNLNRPFIPDGMDVIRYTILAGNTVTLCFYYKQKQLKDFFWKESVDKKRENGKLEQKYF